MKKLILAAVMAIATVSVKASTNAYFMFSVFAPGQLPSYATDLTGMRLSLIYGDCQTLKGLDVGLAGRVRERACALQLGLYNHVGTDATGVELGVWNRVDSDIHGVQLGAANTAEGHAAGVQLGVFNKAESVSGVQLGLVNLADTVKGVQLGLVNRISSQTVSDWQVWFTPFINAGW